MAPSSSTTIISDPEPDYYAFLSLPATATPAEISRAYRLTNLKYHPDKFRPSLETPTAAAAAQKLDFLQKVVAVLKDEGKRRQYDMKREAKVRREEEGKKMEEGRRRMREDLERREKGAGGVGTGLGEGGGVKRTWSERELEVKRIAEENRRRREEMVERKRKAAEDAQVELEEKERKEKEREAEGQNGHVPPVAPEEENGVVDAMHRSVKITWLKANDPTRDLDQDAVQFLCERVGEVENVVMLKDKNKRLNGHKHKSLLGNALVIFATVKAAGKAIEGGLGEEISSIAWAAEKKEGADGG